MATLLGMVLAIHTEAALMCILIFLIVLLASKYVSLVNKLFPGLLLLMIVEAPALELLRKNVSPWLLVIVPLLAMHVAR